MSLHRATFNQVVKLYMLIKQNDNALIKALYGFAVKFNILLSSNIG